MTRLFISLLLLTGFIYNCKPSKNHIQNNQHQTNIVKTNDTITIANDELEYEIIIIDAGFSNWMASRARPKGYHSQPFLENRNYQYTLEWNQRVGNPNRYNPSLYEMLIDYQPNINYGYEVNYKLYNYFIYFQLTYKQRLAAFIPRI